METCRHEWRDALVGKRRIFAAYVDGNHIFAMHYCIDTQDMVICDSKRKDRRQEYVAPLARFAFILTEILGKYNLVFVFEELGVDIFFAEQG